jgi:ribonuclease E
MGLIVRTAGVGKNPEELQWDLDYLLQLWEAIDKASKERSSPFLIYQESNLVIRAIRDYLRKDIAEILIDDKETHEKACEFMQLVMPHNLNKIKYYDDKVPLFTRYQIESQIETAFQREVRLPSGGAIVIDHTEALISIDINSARATKGANIEDTALNTNREAAEEIARQLRLRDLGGLVVIDFIDMYASRNQREVENTLKEALKMDRARVQIGRISRFGLLEMSRQRLRPSLGESVQIVCPRCEGHGTIRSIESLALSILRIIEEDSMKEHTARIIAQVPVNVATFLLNEKRQMISDIESRQKIQVVLIPNATFEVPHFEIQRERASDTEADTDSQSSYSMATEREEVSESISGDKPKLVSEVPAVQGVVPASPQPGRTTKQDGFIKRLFSSLVGSAEEATPEKPVEEKPKRPAQRNRGRGRNNRNSGNRRPQRKTEGQRKPQDRNQKKDAPKNRPEKSAKPDTKTNDPQKTTAVDATNKQTSEKPDQEKQGQQSSGSRRGRRGGRRRRSGGNKQENKTEGTQSETNATNTDSTDTKPSASAAKAVKTSTPATSEANKAKPSENQPQGSTKPVNTVSNTETSEAKTSPVAKTENKPADTKPVETKPVETKPVESKPVESSRQASSEGASKPGGNIKEANQTAKPSAQHTERVTENKPKQVITNKNPAPPTLDTPVTPRPQAARPVQSEPKPALGQVETKPGLTQVETRKPGSTEKKQDKETT